MDSTMVLVNGIPATHNCPGECATRDSIADLVGLFAGYVKTRTVSVAAGLSTRLDSGRSPLLMERPDRAGPVYRSG